MEINLKFSIIIRIKLFFPKNEGGEKQWKVQIIIRSDLI